MSTSHGQPRSISRSHSAGSALSCQTSFSRPSPSRPPAHRRNAYSLRDREQCVHSGRYTQSRKCSATSANSLKPRRISCTTDPKTSSARRNISIVHVLKIEITGLTASIHNDLWKSDVGSSALLYSDAARSPSLNVAKPTGPLSTSRNCLRASIRLSTSQAHNSSTS